MTLMELENISKVFRENNIETHVLADLSFTVQKNEMIAIMGPSGSGKSTLLHLLGCMDIPTTGDYTLDNVVVNSLTKNELAKLRNEKVGFVFQNFHLLNDYTALENVELPLHYRKVSKGKAREKSIQMLEKVGLKDHLFKRPNQLSGGQKQRVAIARALVGQPSIILADEPTGALDQKTSREVLSIFQDLHKNNNTIIIVTHDPDVAAICQRTIIINDGKLQEDRKSLC